jgi:ribulose-bisphosphate carboxylase small chain
MVRYRFATRGQALTEGQIRERVRHCGRNGWTLVIEHTQDPRPDNHYWDRYGVPLFDPEDPDAVLFEINACRKAYPGRYIRVLACEAAPGQARIRDTMMVQVPRA